MDFSDSSVTVEVWADRTGPQTIGIRYNNGSMDGSRRVESTDRLTVNGEPLDETYLPDGTAPSTLTFDVTVPEGRIWVMGDNRGFSQDSRYHQDLPGTGTVSTEMVVGRAVLLFWPLDRFGTLSGHPGVFDAVPAPQG